MGIGDWGLGIGDWAQSPIPKPQSPIPNPHFLFVYYFYKFLTFLIINHIFFKKLFLDFFEKYIFHHQIFINFSTIPKAISFKNYQNYFISFTNTIIYINILKISFILVLNHIKSCFFLKLG